MFDKMPKKNVVTWTTIIDGYYEFGLDDETLRLFEDFIKNWVQANDKMFVCVLNLCRRRLDFELGSQIHACIVKGGWRILIVDSAIVVYYMQSGELQSAFRVFDHMPKWDVVCWTMMATACSQQGHG